MNDLAKSFFISALNANVSVQEGEGATRTLSLLVTCTPAAAEALTAGKLSLTTGGTQCEYR